MVCRRVSRCLLALYLGALLFVGGVRTVEAQPVVAGFTTHEVHGFYVLAADNTDDVLSMKLALREVDRQLGLIAVLDLPEDVLEAMRRVKIFLEYNGQTSGSVAYYHPAEQWLLANGYNPAFAQSVSIPNAVRFTNATRFSQRWLVLHELIHGYHHQVMGFDHGPTIEAFVNAEDTGIYQSVSFNTGDGTPLFNVRAYALTNHVEYLAEISEAFFGRNDYYPFTRSDLVSHDPKGYALLMDLFVNSTSTAVEQLPEDSLLSIYPNPAQDVLRFDSIEAGRVLIYDTTGRVVLSQDVGVGISSIDISTLATGLYLVRLGDGIHDSLHKRTQKIIVAR